MVIILSILAFVFFFVFWEFVAWFMHKYVMHGFLWILHKDHHVTSGRRLQKNDLFAIFFALISFLFIFNGLKYKITPLASAGFGIAAYGLGYVLFHDLMFHKRIRALKFKPKGKYLSGIIHAHRIHHSVITKDGAESFNFLWTPKKYSGKEKSK